MINQVRFRHVDAAIIRASLFPSLSGLPSWPDLTGSNPAPVAEWVAWLRQVWADEHFAEAVTVASPDLADRIRELCEGRVTHPRRVRRVVESALRYLLRASGRATPFGLFAGVAAVRLATKAVMEWGTGHRAIARADGAWLTALINRLEARPDLRAHLQVVANTLAFERGDRLVVPCRLQPGGAATADVTIRNTPAVQAVLKAACTPITIAELTRLLATERPDHPVAEIESMLAVLVQHSVLISSLHPPMDVTDPLTHLIANLAALGHAAPADVLCQLRTIRDELAQHARSVSSHERHAKRTSATERMATVHDRPAPALAIDLRLDCRTTLPDTVVREAAGAAAVLVRLSQHPYGSPSWRDYHEAFLNRWGIGAVVPLADVVNADTGLGYPAGYRGSPAKGSPPPLTGRDRALLRLAQRAALHGQEVVLDEDTLIKLAAGADEPRPPYPVPHTELRFALHAATTAAINAGDFTLVVVSAARQAGTTVGRFLHLLPPGDRDRMAGVLAELPTLHPGAVLAQISCPPLSPRAANLARGPAITTLIPLGEHQLPELDHLPLHDLAVSGDAHRLFLVSLSRGEVVEPLMANALDLRRATHPLARFLCEITYARSAACVPFTWGAAATLPFLPRIRYRRTILSPATWNLTATDLPNPQTDWPAWAQAWQSLRTLHRIPGLVFLGDSDVRLRLDLDEPAHLAILRAHLNREHAATLTEAPGHQAYGWTGGHAHEIVLPLAAAPAPRPGNTAPPAGHVGTPLLPLHHPGHPPGASPWLYVRLYAQPDSQSEILTRHLSGLLAEWQEGPEDGWWFLRHHNPQPHLRLRFPLHDVDHYGPAARRVGAWASRVRERGLLRDLVFDTYYPEPGRYGAGAALQAAETVFAADSRATLAQLTMTALAGLCPAAVTTASIFDLATAFTGGNDAGTAWLVQHVPRRPAPPIDRALHNEAQSLANPCRDWAALRALPGGDQVTRAWQRRRQTLAAYRAHLADQHTPGHPAGQSQPDAVLASLLHLHHARMTGIDHASERLCLRLARAAALAHQHRSKR
ncbi:lantibiotic dehydratase [Acrocarpospora catenulata]|uniref:lantibiotic dehydratase n=1 Tax=Acrocarpospora catenulata TaxID=2836182 RepID=UPI001BDB6950|nr:lantibiotic dehydratase [Acrocarpospora catenulata]